MAARFCPQLSRLEIQHCVNITNGGLMDLVTKCQMLDHLDVTGKTTPLSKKVLIFISIDDSRRAKVNNNGYSLKIYIHT